jgi:hypothetical protein
MEDQELKNIWKAYDQKLEKLITVNLKYIEAMQAQKARSKINSILISHIIGIVLGTAWVFCLGFLAYHNLDNLYFSISLGMIMIFTGIAVIAYIEHVMIIHQINISENITETQQKLAMVQTSLNKTGRLLILQLPFYCTFFLSENIVAHGDITFWIIQITVTISFTFLTVWLYRNLTPENMHKKWVRVIVDSFGMKSLRKAMEFLNEIEEFKKDVPKSSPSVG